MDSQPVFAKKVGLVKPSLPRSDHSPCPLKISSDILLGQKKKGSHHHSNPTSMYGIQSNQLQEGEEVKHRAPGQALKLGCKGCHSANWRLKSRHFPCKQLQRDAFNDFTYCSEDLKAFQLSRVSKYFPQRVAPHSAEGDEDVVKPDEEQAIWTYTNLEMPCFKAAFDLEVI